MTDATEAKVNRAVFSPDGGLTPKADYVLGTISDAVCETAHTFTTAGDPAAAALATAEVIRRAVERERPEDLAGVLLAACVTLAVNLTENYSEEQMRASLVRMSDAEDEEEEDEFDDDDFDDEEDDDYEDEFDDDDEDYEDEEEGDYEDDEEDDVDFDDDEEGEDDL